MREIRARRVSADTITEIAVENQPLVFYAGKSDSLLRVYGLPVREWRASIGIAYGNRAPVRVNRGELSEAILLQLIAGQVDADWQPCSYGVLVVGGTDALYLVPGNAYWRALVEGEDDK